MLSPRAALGTAGGPLVTGRDRGLRGSGYQAFPGISADSTRQYAANLNINKKKLGGPPRQSLAHFAHQQVGLGSMGGASQTIDPDLSHSGGGRGTGPRTARTGAARAPGGVSDGAPAAQPHGGPPGGVSSDKQSGYMKASQIFSPKASHGQPATITSNAYSRSQKAGAL